MPLLALAVVWAWKYFGLNALLAPLWLKLQTLLVVKWIMSIIGWSQQTVVWTAVSPIITLVQTVVWTVVSSIITLVLQVVRRAPRAEAVPADAAAPHAAASATRERNISAENNERNIARSTTAPLS